ncbi:hypothetical protein C8T65DRAFT_700260 [Cerioporus squamosus]|nr:hypothetical protein C8T65DRAFT_700260 [Cerioporus squamosus]
MKDATSQLETSKSYARPAACTRQRSAVKTASGVRLDHPLHHLEIWDGQKFARTSLETLGMKIQIGHSGGSRKACSHPSAIARRVIICDSTGIFAHRLSDTIVFASGASGKTQVIWINPDDLRKVPTWTSPRAATVFTFRLLNTFQELNFQGKTNLYDFWKTIERITDNSGGADVPRFGRAHDPAGAGATQPRELVLDCAACPQPGKNLPDDWEKAPSHRRWLYTLYLMIDANFRARCKDRGIEDIHLAPGWSHYVKESAYQKHLARARNDKEENTCSAEHNAILKANSRKEGYIASGIGAVLCARHALVRKNSAGDLQLGEGYANMDYLVFSTLIGILILALLLLYDIACQWSKHFFKRMEENFPPIMQIDRTKVKDIRFAIPKHHYCVHGGEPHLRWSLNFLRWVGRTYGEGIESHWSHVNPLALSTREMGLGMRHETYDDHWGAWNWQKTISLCNYNVIVNCPCANKGGVVATTLLRALEEACKMSISQRKVYQDYTVNIPADTVDEWDAMLKAWHADLDQPDPFQEPTIAISLASEKLKLNEEEAVEAAQGKLPLHDITPGMLLQVGLELEEKQRALRQRAKKGRSMTELAQQQQKRNALMRRIESWQAGQDFHMPMVAEFRAATSQDAAVAPTRAEDVPLWLPSAIPATFLVSESLLALREKEKHLRIAQMADSLSGIRHIRRVLAAITEFTRVNVSGLGQRSVTRNQSLYTRFMDKQKRCAARYRDARAAMEKLDPDGPWKQTYKPLLDEDLRGPRRDDDEVIPSEGRYVPSWIWLTPVGARGPRDQSERASDEEFAETMRAEWARCKSRADRWDEEKKLLLEEMRRVIAYFNWKAHWWQKQATRQGGVHAWLQRGLSVYAHKQAAIWEALAARTASFWVNKLKELGPQPDWILPYEHLARKVHPRRRAAITPDAADYQAAADAGGDDFDEDSNASDDGL